MLFTITGALLLAALPSSAGSTPDGDPRLTAALTQLRVQAKKYEDSALRFTSDETILFHHQHGREKYDFRYFYRRRNDGALDDYRQAAS